MIKNWDRWSYKPPENILDVTDILKIFSETSRRLKNESECLISILYWILSYSAIPEKMFSGHRRLKKHIN